MPAWLARAGVGAGASLLKKHLKEKGKELVGEARKKAIAKLAKKTKTKKKEKKKEKKDKKTDKKTAKKKYKITSESFKKKPMTEKQARHATRQQKKYEGKGPGRIWKHEGKTIKMPDSDGGYAARVKGINRLDRSDAPRQRFLPERLPSKKGKTKILKLKYNTARWIEEYK